MDKFQEPIGLKVIQLSGGNTSMYMLGQILQKHGGVLPPDYLTMFQNTGREMPETYDFLNDMTKHWGVDVIWVEYTSEKPFYKIVNFETASRDGKPFEELIAKRGYLPNAFERFCTVELKVLTSRRFLTNHDALKHIPNHQRQWNSAIGIRFDENHRLLNRKKDKRIKPFYPLNDLQTTKQDVSDFWEKQNWGLNLPIVNGTTPLSNCDGCFLKSEKTQAYLCSTYPKRAQWWDEMENKIGATFRKKAGWTNLIDFVDRQAAFDFNDEHTYCDTVLGGCNDE